MDRLSVGMFTIILALTAVPCADAGQASDLWVYASTADVQHFELTPGGDLFVSTNSSVAVISGQSGKLVWSRSDIGDCKVRIADVFMIRNVLPRIECRYIGHKNAHFYILGGTRYSVFVPDDRFAVVDIETGSTLFDSANEPLAKVISYQYVPRLNQIVLYAENRQGGYLLTGLGLSDGKRQWTDELTISRDFAWAGMPDDQILLVYGKNRQNRRILAGVDLGTGNVWEKTDLLSEDGNPLRARRAIADTASTLILICTKDGPMRLDRQGGLLWKSVPLSGKEPLPFIPFAMEKRGAIFTRSDVVSRNRELWITDKDILFLAQGDTVFAVNTADGRVMWRHNSRFDPRGLQVSRYGRCQ